MLEHGGCMLCCVIAQRPAQDHLQNCRVLEYDAKHYNQPGWQGLFAQCASHSYTLTLTTSSSNSKHTQQIQGGSLVELLLPHSAHCVARQQHP